MTNLNTQEAAKLLGYHPQSLRDLVRVGKLPATKGANGWIFDREELLDLQKKAKDTGSTVSKVFLLLKSLRKSAESL